MPRFTLDQISKMPAKNQSEVIAQMGPKIERPVSSPTLAAETRQEVVGSPALAHSALDQTPVHIPAELIRHILDNWASAFHVSGTETQRRKVVANAVQALARREANPNSIP